MTRALVRFVPILIAASALTPSARAGETYRRREISDARYRTSEHAKLLTKAYSIPEVIGRRVYGQDPALKLLAAQISRYLESFGTREGGPPAINLAGLPGIGKSAIIDGLRAMDFPIVHFDAQSYTAGGPSRFDQDVHRALRPYQREKKPVILVVEEIDKVAELGQRGGDRTIPIIGVLNQILSNGILTVDGDAIAVPNIMVITDMNIPPEYIDAFSKEVLKKDKTFFDYDDDDIRRLDTWLRTEPTAVYKILSKIFRNNTVGRLAPITLLMSPLFEDSYRRIARGQAEAAARMIVGPGNAAKRVSVEFDDAVIDMLARRTKYAPSGSRETVARASLLSEQLVNFAIKARDPAGESLDRPRSIKILGDEAHGLARVVIEPSKQIGRRLVADAPFTYQVPYDPDSRLFDIPRDSLVFEPPAASKTREDRPRRVTQAQIFATRYPLAKARTEGVKEFLNANVFGQETAVDLIDEDVRRVAARAVGSRGKPIFRVLAGFPGIGKSELVVLLARHLKIPLVKINMQHYAGKDDNASKNFLANLKRRVSAARESKTRFILLIEEIDKLYEIDPTNGELKDRPALGVVKDLLNDGVVSVAGDYAISEIDLRDQLTFLTMNFTVDRFGFNADPRLTSIDDVYRAYQQLSMTLMAQKSMLGSMFLPDTVSRLMPRTTILPPLREDNYRSIIAQQTSHIIDDRFRSEGGVDLGQVQIEMRPAYADYLFEDTVIPSEGARNTAVTARSLIETHVEETINQIAPTSKFARRPITVSLDFDPTGPRVEGAVRLSGEGRGREPRVVLKKDVVLAFPSLRKDGLLDPKRLWVTAHEIGHALSRIKLGLRFEHIVVVSPDPRTYGYVSFPSRGMFAQEVVGGIYSALAGRAMERMVFSETPEDTRSLLDITQGSSSDLEQATYALYTLIYSIGLDPGGGSANRGFSIHGKKYGSFQDMPAPLAEKLGRVLRGMENNILRDLQNAHDLAWYVDKISTLAHEGKMTEEEFYRLVDYPYPGTNRFGDDQMQKRASYHLNPRLQSLFAGHIEAPTPAEEIARRGRGEGPTPPEYWARVMNEFNQLIEIHLHERDPRKIVEIECDQSLAQAAKDVGDQATVHVKR